MGTFSSGSLVVQGPAKQHLWFWLLTLAFTVGQPSIARALCAPADVGTGVSMTVADGQLTSAPFQVFVDSAVTLADKPRLQLHAASAITADLVGEHMRLVPVLVAPNQAVIVNVGGQDVARCGTLLQFDLRPYPIDWYKPMRRVEPVLVWQPPGTEASAWPVLAVGSRVNVGQPVQAWLWTLLVTLAIVALISALTGPSSRLRRAGLHLLKMTGVRWSALGSQTAVTPPYCLLCAEDGHLSLSKVQIVLWTLAIGAAVFFYGLVRVEVPSVPNTLVVLMGLSLVTGGLSYVAPDGIAAADKLQPPFDGAKGVAAPLSAEPAAVPHSAAPGVDTLQAPAIAPRKPNLSDLICNFYVGKPPELSVARAQMLFWTVILVTLFVWKSALNGSLWDVPVQLVALTGISQLGYIAPKFAPETKDKAAVQRPPSQATTPGG